MLHLGEGQGGDREGQNGYCFVFETSRHRPRLQLIQVPAESGFPAEIRGDSAGINNNELLSGRAVRVIRHGVRGEGIVRGRALRLPARRASPILGSAGCPTSKRSDNTDGRGRGRCRSVRAIANRSIFRHPRARALRLAVATGRMRRSQIHSAAASPSSWASARHDVVGFGWGLRLVVLSAQSSDSQSGAPCIGVFP